MPAVLIALLAIGTNLFADAVARAAIGADRQVERPSSAPKPPRRPREAVVTTPNRLVVEDLQVCLAGTRTDVVSEVDFEVAPGEVLGLVGESGSGKTTVALALLGYRDAGLHITGGRILLDGQDILAIGEPELPALRGGKVAYVPQEPSAALNPVRRVGTRLPRCCVSTQDAHKDSDVAGGASARCSPPSTCRQTRPSCAVSPHQLSGGQQQRIVIAMAFACRPGVIVFDEPTTGLDVTTQRHFLELIADLCATSGVAAVYVSHDLAVVGQVAKAVAVMYAGRIVELGPTAEVFATPDTRTRACSCGPFRPSTRRRSWRGSRGCLRDRSAGRLDVRSRPGAPMPDPSACQPAGEDGDFRIALGAMRAGSPGCPGNRRTTGHSADERDADPSGCARGGGTAGVLRYERSAPRRQLHVARGQLCSRRGRIRVGQDDAGALHHRHAHELAGKHPLRGQRAGPRCPPSAARTC